MPHDHQNPDCNCESCQAIDKELAAHREAEAARRKAEAEAAEGLPWLGRTYQASDDRLGWLCKADETSADFVTPFTMSTDTHDRMGDIVEQTWRLANYRANPVVLFGHDPARGVVGRGVGSGNNRVRIAERGKGKGKHKVLAGSVKWDVSEHNALGTMLGHQYKEGMMHAGSVGFVSHKRIRLTELPTEDPRKRSEGYGMLLAHNELLEFSAVPIPANAKALAEREAIAEAIAQGAPSSEVVKAAIQEYLPAQIRAVILDQLRHDEDTRAILESYVLSLIEAPEEAPEVGGNGTGGKDWFDRI